MNSLNVTQRPSQPLTSPINQALHWPLALSSQSMDGADSFATSPMGLGRPHATLLGLSNPRSVAVVSRGSMVKLPPQGRSANFDFDDNLVMHMPTPIRIYHRQTGETREVSSAEWSLIRKSLGKEGPWKDYEARDDSLSEFSDTGPRGADALLMDLKTRIGNAMTKDGAQHPKDSTSWQGPSWDAFVKAMSTKQSAAQTTIITSRLHAPQTILKAMRYLQQQGLIKHVPTLENIYPVKHPDFAQTYGPNSSKAKARVMMERLDALQRAPLLPGAKRTRTPQGDERRAMHLWTFSDDDFGNFSAALEALTANAKRWPNVKIALFYTGQNHPTERARVVIVRPGSAPRPATADELLELEDIVGWSHVKRCSDL